MGAKAVNEEEKSLILTLHENGIKSVEIANKLGRHTTTICKVLKSFNINATNHHKLDEAEIDSIVELYINGKTIKDIHRLYKHLNISEGAINYHLRKRKVTRRNGKQVKLDHDYFENIDTEHKAYFLGLIAADGSVMKQQKSKNGYSHSLRLELMADDRYIIEHLKNELKSDLNVKEYKSSNNRSGWKEKHNAYIQFHSKKLFDDLGNYGIHPNKTVNLEALPSIDDEYMRHYIRGFFDGDGTVYLNSNYSEPRPIFGFYGTFDFLDNLQEYLISKLNINRRKITKQKDANVCFVTYSTKSNIVDFYNYIYEGANIFLKRKKDKFDIFIENN